MRWFRSLRYNVLINLIIFNDERMQKLFEHPVRLVPEVRNTFEKVNFLVHLPNFKLPQHLLIVLLSYSGEFTINHAFDSSHPFGVI